MTFRLTSREAELLVRGATTFAAPFAAPSLSEWRRRCVDAIGPLLNTDRAASIMSVAGGEPLHVQPPDLDEMARAWGEHYYQYDTALLRSGESVRRGVFHLSDLYDLDALRPSPFWTEWIVPFRGENGFGMAVSVPQSEVPVSFHGYPSSDAISARRGRSLLSLLYPAFVAGTRAALQAIDAERDRVEMLERESEGIVVADLDERMVYVSARLAPILDDRAPSGALAIAIHKVIRQAIGLIRPLTKSRSAEPVVLARGIVTRAQGLVVRAIVLHGYTGSGDPLVTVIVSRETRLCDDDTALMKRFALTRRECEVARAIGSGRSSQDISTRLGISIHTTRRHTERVFTKLGVSTRAAVAAILNDFGPS